MFIKTKLAYSIVKIKKEMGCRKKNCCSASTESLEIWEECLI